MPEKPLIGISLDHSNKKTYASYPWYALRQNYFDAIQQAGGIPLALPYDHGAIDKYITLVDGLLIPGGDDMDPLLYKDKEVHEKTLCNKIRSDFDHALMKKALEKKIPFLGICAGAQMLNVALGGTLYQHIPDILQDSYHEQKTPKHMCSHTISIEPHTRLYAIAGSSAEVNSTHHQAIKHLGDRLIVSAKAPDGIIEAIELQDDFFCVGVQWHPEYQTTSLDRCLFSEFIKASL